VRPESWYAPHDLLGAELGVGTVLERQVGGKATWQPGDRILLAALSRLLPKTGSTAQMPSPETLLRWHRDLARRK